MKDGKPAIVIEPQIDLIDDGAGKPVGIARAKSGDITPAGEKFCEILRKVSKGEGGGSKAATG